MASSASNRPLPTPPSSVSAIKVIERPLPNIPGAPSPRPLPPPRPKTPLKENPLPQDVQRTEIEKPQQTLPSLPPRPTSRNSGEQQPPTVQPSPPALPERVVQKHTEPIKEQPEQRPLPELPRPPLPERGQPLNEQQTKGQVEEVEHGSKEDTKHKSHHKHHKHHKHDDKDSLDKQDRKERKEIEHAKKKLSTKEIRHLAKLFFTGHEGRPNKRSVALELIRLVSNFLASHP